MTILDRMDDPAYFGRFFAGEEWRAWKAFVGALYGVPLGPKLRAVCARHTERTELPPAPVREGWMAVGRRGGKSRIAAFLAVDTACRDYHPFLAPGETALIPVLASDKDQAGAIFGYVLGFLEQVPALRALTVGKPTGQRVLLATGVEIKVRAATFRGLRGRPIPLALCDEIAFWRNEDSRNPDHEILTALRPGMLTIPGAMLLGLSSPYAKRGVLWERYRDRFGVNDPRTLVWQADTLSMNPTADRAEIQAAYDDDPISAAAEYGGLFRDDLAAYVPTELVDAAMKDQPAERLPVVGLHYDAFCDPSGGSSDSMTMAIAHEEAGVFVLDCIRERRPPFSPEAVVAEFAAVLKSYGTTTVQGDRYAGEWPRERFAVHGVTYVPAEMPKSELYLQFLPALTSGKTRLLNAPVLRRQLCALDRRTTRAGKDAVDHPPGSHDDVANAAVGALLLTAGAGIAGEGMFRFIGAQAKAKSTREQAERDAIPGRAA